jgi:hypothetical protein
MRANKPAEIKTLAPEEWDFRGVTLKELPTALQYEYARSSEWFLRWLDSTFQGFSSEALNKIRAQSNLANKAVDGPMSIRKALDILRQSKSLERSLLGVELLPPHTPKLRERLAAAEFAIHFDRFPTPWLCLPGEYRSSRLPSGRTISAGPVAEIPWSVNCNIDYTEEEFKAPVQFYQFAINWPKSDKQLVAAFTRWLKRRRPKIFKGKSQVGNASLPPFHLLRQLAAWRLRQAGYSHERAATLIATRIREKPAGSAADLLPNYKGSAAWSKAVRRAADILASEDIFRLTTQGGLSAR